LSGNLEMSGNLKPVSELSGNKPCHGKWYQKLVVEEQNMKESRKRKALISSLEQQKRLKLDELKSQTQEIDKQIAELNASK